MRELDPRGAILSDQRLDLLGIEFNVCILGLLARLSHPSAGNENEIHGFRQCDSIVPDGRPFFVVFRGFSFGTLFRYRHSDGIPQSIRARLHHGLHDVPNRESRRNFRNGGFWG